MTSIFSNPSYFMPPLIGGAVTLVLLLVALVWSRRDFTTWLFCGFLTSMVLSSLLVFAMRISPSADNALLWERAGIIPAVAGFVFYYHFVLVYTNTRSQKYALRAAYLFLIIAVALAPTDLVIRQMRVIEYGYAPVVGPAAYLWFAAGPILVLVAAYNLLRHYRVSTSPEERRRLIILAIATTLPIIGMLWDGFTTLPPLSVWSNLLFTILCTIAILKYRLLDIQIIVRKSLVYVLVSAVAAIPFVGILLLVSYIFGSAANRWWAYGGLLMLLAILLRPLYGWAQNFVDKLFFGKRYDYLRALRDFSQETHHVSDLGRIGSSLVNLVSQALGSVHVYLLSCADGQNFTTVASTEENAIPINFSNSDLLLQWLQSHNRPLYRHDLLGVPELQHVAAITLDPLHKKPVALLVPIMTRDEALVGLLMLGEKLSQQSYSSDDENLLMTVTSRLAIELENARLYEAERTVRKQLEEQDKMKTEFLHSVAHELNTPLTAILASSELLDEESSRARVFKSRLVKNIRRSALSMQRRVAELLDFARTQTGQLKINPEPLEMGDIITDVTSQIGILFENKQQELTLEIPNSLPKVNADRGRVEQVLYNLLSNANKFSPAGSQILMRTKHEDGKVIVEVEDSAPPITEAEKTRLFEPYYRGEDEDERMRLSGLGLGLTVSKKIVEMHQGEIWLKNRSGGGNIFGFSLPTLRKKKSGESSFPLMKAEGGGSESNNH